MTTVLVTGATGFVGQHVCALLSARGDAVRVVSRSPDAARSLLPEASEVHHWDPARDLLPSAALDGADVILHLAGENVSGRWTVTKRQAIESSRVDGTRNLVQAIAASQSRPTKLVTASAIGYYGDRSEERLTEESSPGNDFLAVVCRRWEREGRRAEELGVEVTRLRFGIVLGLGGGALDAMLLPARLGLSGPLGSGKQWWSWIHLDDCARLVLQALNTSMPGAFNATAPNAVRQAEFARALGRVLRRPASLPAPAIALKLAVGGFSSELLSSKQVLPARTLSTGFNFSFTKIEPALVDLLG